MEKELTDFQKRLLAKFNPAKPVMFRYDVVDCEHSGDIWHDECVVRRFIEPYNGEITRTYWDGHDCGEAYIECQIPYKEVEKVLLSGFFEYDPWQE